MQIKNFAKIEYLTAIELIKHEGRHSRLNFTASISIDNDESFLGCVGSTLSLMLDERTTIFYGRVESVEVERAVGAARVHASCVSLSSATDEQPKTRIFHNPDKKISDVLDKSRLKLESCGLRLDNEIASKPYTGVLLQNGETNFSFITRLANNINSRFWVIDTMSKPEIFFAPCVNESARKLTSKQVLSIKRAKCGDRSRVTLKTGAYFELGSVVTVETEARDMTEYVIVGLRAELDKESDIFTYELDERKPAPPLENKAPVPAKTVKLHAKVKSVKDPKNLGRIQVTFDDEFIEDMDQKSPLWIAYRSAYSGAGGGIVFLPDEGDPIEVIFCNEEIYAASTLREKPLLEECRKVVEKYIGNNTKQRMFWKEKSLELFSDKYKIVMNEKGIELTVGENSIALTEKDIKIKTKGSEISLADDKIKVNCGEISLSGKDKIKTDSGELSVNSSGKINVNASGNMKLAGSKIELC